MGNGTKRVYVGGLAVGAGAPVSVQSMTCTDTKDVDATVAQIHALTDAGCDIVRCAVYDRGCADALAEIRPQISVPLVADIHFDYRLAIAAMEKGADKIRFNPGNIGDAEHVRSVAACATEHNVPIRIGVNGGSLEKDLLEKYGVTAEAMVESGVRHAEMLEKYGFSDIVLSLKSSDVKTTVEAYRRAAGLLPYPLHLGITEAGMGEEALLRSAIGVGSLLLDGIGDTMRVSLTGGVIEEVEAAKKILAALDIRRDSVRIVSCPTCGRTRVDLASIVSRVREALSFEGVKPIKVAVMGCAVNGPGEAREADIGIAFGSVNAAVFGRGGILYTDKLPGVIDRFIEDAKKLCTKE